MSERPKDYALLTDFYQLTSADIFLHNNKNDIASYDLFVRKLPKDWGYYLAGGIDEAVQYISELRYEQHHLDYLDSLKAWSPELLDYLAKFKFEGDVFALAEGTPFAPNTPVMRITARRIDAQILETTLLNIINFPTMIGAKASRIVTAANGAMLAEFGLRRAQKEDAAMDAARMAYIAGFASTSNLKAGLMYGIPVGGTIPHAVVTAFDDELGAFRAVGGLHPEKVSLLIDTYKIPKGARNAALVGLELEKIGGRLASVRIDSGDLASESREVRKILDQHGLNYVAIAGSDDLDEYKITELVENGAFNMFGVGTRNVTGHPVGAIPGVYKLVEDTSGPKMKLAEGKRNYPALKQLFRQVSSDGKYSHDVMGLESENIPGIRLLEPTVIGGQVVRAEESIHQIRERSLSQVAMLPPEVKRVINSKQYPVEISEKLHDLTEQTVQKLSKIGEG